MYKYVIVPIVEGRGAKEAVPILLRNWLRFRRYHRNVEVDLAGPVFTGGKGTLAAAHDSAWRRGVEHYVHLALLRQPDVILVLLDADDDCPETLAAGLLARARTLVPADYPIGVAVAKREYEAWFLAAFPTDRFRQGLVQQGFRLTRHSLPRGMDVEAIADCKKEVAKLLGLTKYSPTKHQPALTRILPFTRGMSRRSRSFQKLLEELDGLLVQARRRRSRSVRP